MEGRKKEEVPSIGRENQPIKQILLRQDRQETEGNEVSEETEKKGRQASDHFLGPRFPAAYLSCFASICGSLLTSKRVERI